MERGAAASESAASESFCPMASDGAAVESACWCGVGVTAAWTVVSGPGTFVAELSAGSGVMTVSLISSIIRRAPAEVESKPAGAVLSSPMVRESVQAAWDIPASLFIGRETAPTESAHSSTIAIIYS